MTKSLLFLTFSPRSASNSSGLARKFIDQWKSANPDAPIVEHDFGQTPMAGPDQAWIEANMTPKEQRSSAQRATLAASDKAISELRAATHVVLATPMFNFSTPWQLKSYIDNLVRNNETFGFDPETGPIPLLDQKKKMKVIWSSAFDYAVGNDMKALDQLTPYISTIFGFMGVTDISFVGSGNAWASTEVAHQFRSKAENELANAAPTW
ncbi:NAD(P)H-dependent oxidoreductase [uncultured Celeribacter sp.]|uniref:FMN-dependent NADH-azoreductase n=1 Tax=uncultured Celeribacter sp. TaxID=1303376 RepID=UPI002AA76D9D|nr:NAD(P)H-dependent oxidoreductase [uncultured Celeribacter sp.]